MGKVGVGVELDRRPGQQAFPVGMGLGEIDPFTGREVFAHQALFRQAEDQSGERDSEIGMGQVLTIPVQDGRRGWSRRGSEFLEFFFVCLDDPDDFGIDPIQLVVLACESHGDPGRDRLVFAKLGRLSHVAIAFGIHGLRGGGHVDPCGAVFIESELDLESSRADHGHFQSPESPFTEVLEASLQSGRVQLLGQRIGTKAFQILERGKLHWS